MILFTVRISYSNMSQNIQNLLDTCLAALAKASELEAQNAALVAQNAALVAQNAALEAENAALEAKATSLEAQNDALVAQNAALEAENAALVAQNAALEAENAALEAKATSLEAQNDALVMSNRSITAVNDDLNMRLGALSQIHDALLKMYQELAHSMVVLQNQTHEISSKVHFFEALQNPVVWMLSDEVPGKIALLQQILEEHYGEMKDCRNNQYQLESIKFIVEEALQQGREPDRNLLDQQLELTEKVERCMGMRERFTQQIDSCLRTLFLTLTSTDAFE